MTHKLSIIRSLSTRARLRLWAPGYRVIRQLIDNVRPVFYCARKMSNGWMFVHILEEEFTRERLVRAGWYVTRERDHLGTFSMRHLTRDDIVLLVTPAGRVSADFVLTREV